MRLIFDEYDGYYVWVADEDETDELSPRFDEEHDAMQWRQRMKKIFTGK